MEEKVLRKKYRACWIDCGDANTKYFHAQLNIRTNHNTIAFIYTEDGVKINDPLEIENEFISFFQSLMGKKEDKLPYPDSRVIQNGPRLDRDQQLLLIGEVTLEEIEQAFKGMPNDKSPGVDGFPIEFFKSNWELVKTKVCEDIQ